MASLALDESRAIVVTEVDDCMLLTDKVAFITGSATGIGNAIARLFAEHGASLILVDRNREQNRALAAELEKGGATVRAGDLDVRDRPAIDAAVGDALRVLGHIDILVNNAGVYPRQAFLDMSEQQWDEMQAINLKSMFHTTQSILPGMIARGSGQDCEHLFRDIPSRHGQSGALCGVEGRRDWFDEIAGARVRRT